MRFNPSFLPPCLHINWPLGVVMVPLSPSELCPQTFMMIQVHWPHVGSGSWGALGVVMVPLPHSELCPQTFMMIHVHWPYVGSGNWGATHISIWIDVTGLFRGWWWLRGSLIHLNSVHIQMHIYDATGSWGVIMHFGISISNKHNTVDLTLYFPMPRCTFCSCQSGDVANGKLAEAYMFVIWSFVLRTAPHIASQLV